MDAAVARINVAVAKEPLISKKILQSEPRKAATDTGRAPSKPSLALV